MFGQELLHDAAIIASLVILEGLLSADNALVLAILVRHLPKHQQPRALKYGIIGAFVFRAIGVITASKLMHYWEFKALGALYLLYLAAKHFLHKFNNRNEPINARPTGPGFWKTIALVEMTDVAFSIDSIVAAVAMSKKVWIVYLGGILGIIAMRFVAGLFLKLLEKFPRLEAAAYCLVGWIGIKLGLECANQVITGKVEHGPYTLPIWLFWMVMILIFLAGLISPKAKGGVVNHAEEIKEFQKEEGMFIPPRHKPKAD